MPARFELVGGTSDVRLAGIGGAAAIEHVGMPGLVPEALELYRLGVDCRRMQRHAVGSPLARGRIESSEQPPHRVLSGGTARKRRVDRGRRALDDVEDSLAVEERERIGKDDT